MVKQAQGGRNHLFEKSIHKVGWREAEGVVR
jgi:hypothetical protein